LLSRSTGGSRVDQRWLVAEAGLIASAIDSDPRRDRWSGCNCDDVDRWVVEQPFDRPRARRADEERDRLTGRGGDIHDAMYRELVSQPRQDWPVDGLRDPSCTQDAGSDGGLHPWLLTTMKPDRSYSF